MYAFLLISLSVNKSPGSHTAARSMTMTIDPTGIGRRKYGWQDLVFVHIGQRVRRSEWNVGRLNKDFKC